MSILKALPNQPLTLSLSNPNGEEVKGQYGIQFKYRLQGGNLIYLPPIAHDEIQSLHPGAGEPFTLTKSIGQGNQTVWKVERIQPGSPEVRTDCPAPLGGTTATPTNYTAPKSITIKNGVKPAVAVMPSAAASLSTPQSRAMVRQLFAAVDACKLTQDYAKQQGLVFEPTADIICRVAITGGIQVFKEGVY